MNCHKSNFISQFGIDLRISKFMNFSGMFKNCWKLEPKIHVNSINLSLKNTNTLFICILVHRIIVKYSRSRDWNRFLRSWQLKQQTLRTAVPWACSEAVAMCHVVCEIICEIELIMNARWLVEECVRAGSQFMCRYLHRRRQRVTLMVTQTPRCSEVAKLVQDTARQNRLPFFLILLIVVHIYFQATKLDDNLINFVYWFNVCLKVSSHYEQILCVSEGYLSV